MKWGIVLNTSTTGRSLSRRRPRLLIFIVAYEAEATIKKVISRIPSTLATDYDIEVLIIDDASSDETFQHSLDLSRSGTLPFPVKVLFNPMNQGYGGNQKIGYHYALTHGFDFVALLHGDGQYAPECLPDLVAPVRDGKAHACFGSRMIIKGGALRGGMPLYKFLGNKVLTWFENRMLSARLTEFHSGYRVYSVEALRRIPFSINSNDFHFDTEIIIQLMIAELIILELPIPTYYGDEICRVNGIRYAWNVARAVMKARAQHLGLFYDRRFDCAPNQSENYLPKFDYESPHSLAVELVGSGATVLDLGCAGGYVGAKLKQVKQCRVIGVDTCPLGRQVELDGFEHWDLNSGMPNVDMKTFDFVLMLDVIEHLKNPEAFVRDLGDALKFAPNTRILVSTGNIAFAVTRVMLMLGQFNYGKRGILDLTHTRLFTFSSLGRLFEGAGFRIIGVRGIPGPFALALGSGKTGTFFLNLNKLLIRISKGLFSYQIFMIIQPCPSLEHLLGLAEQHSVERIAQCE
jgi:glycosyltransferase involved in cell wall biosynthesis